MKIFRKLPFVVVCLAAVFVTRADCIDDSGKPADFPWPQLESVQEVLKRNAQADIIKPMEVQLPQPERVQPEKMVVMRVSKEDGDVAPAKSAVDAFAVDMFRDLVAEREGNVVFSPVSLEETLILLEQGARGKTLQAFRSLRTCPRAVVYGLQVKSADALFVAEDLKLKPVAVEAVHRVSFIDAAGAARTINDWCKGETRGAVPSIVTPDTFDASTRMVVVNAVYFKERWLRPFDKAETVVNGFFRLPDGGFAQSPLMSQTAEFRYAEGEDWQAVALPFDSIRDIGCAPGPYFIGILPKGDARRFAATLTPEKYSAILKALAEAPWEPVSITLPKMKADTDAALLKAALTRQGLGCLFTEDADFSGFADEPLYVSKILQRCHIMVDEVEAEASAVTVAEVCFLGLETEPAPPHVIRFDRPFIWVIGNLDASFAPLFMGLFENP